MKAERQSILLDLGQGTWRRLLQAERDPARVKAVLISHLHPDHVVADLIPLLFALNYDPHIKAHARMILVGHPDPQGLLGGLTDIWGHWVQPRAENLGTSWLSSGYQLRLGEWPCAPAPPATPGPTWPTWATASPPSSWWSSAKART